MTYNKTNYQDVDPISDAMHFLREPLDSNQLGLTVVECDAGWTGMEHNHSDEEHEKVSS